MTRLISVSVVLLLCVVGCVDRTRVNTRCEWNPDADGTLDLRDRQQERHLDDDVELATELAVRYADSMHKQLFGYEGHGGLIEGGRLRDRCMATLLSAIATAHEVPLNRVMQARTRSRRPLAWDASVMLSFLVFYVSISWVIARPISRRFPVDEGWPSLAAPVIASFGVSAAGSQLGGLWGTVMETIRVGNDHLSGYRGSWKPWDEHLVEIYVVGVILFLVTAALRSYLLDRRRFNPSRHAV
jgi:hypothetical protein